MQKEKFVQNIFFSFIKTGCKSVLSWEGSSIYKKGVGQLTKGVENSNVLVASFLTVVTAITISVSGVTVVSTAVVSTIVTAITVSVSMSVISVPCVSSGISIGISGPLAQVVSVISTVVGVTVVSTVSVSVVSKSISITVSTAIVSVPCVSSGISASFGLRLCHDSGNNESYEKQDFHDWL